MGVSLHSIQLIYAVKSFAALPRSTPLSSEHPRVVLFGTAAATVGRSSMLPTTIWFIQTSRAADAKKKLHDAAIKTFLTHVSGTSVDMIRSKKTPTNNTSGVRGVYFIKGKWSAKIVFQKKQYHLGNFDSIDDAASARREAEILLFDGAAAHYDRWKKRADEDPAWAASNPISIQVEKKEDNTISIRFLPVMEQMERITYALGEGH